MDVVLEQLAELAGQGLPALLTAATREAHLLRLYGSAAEACAARGERLVLLVDGLDADRGVTTGSDARSIASVLPYDLPVIVSGRFNPLLPLDVPEDHPLRDPEAVRILSPSPRARVIRAEAERELKRLLEAGELPYELLALLTAAGGGLTAADLAELTGEVPCRVADVLRTGPGRTFAVRGEAYLLAHEELAAGAREMLGEGVLGRGRSRLHAWAEEWRGRGWPATTPAYLLYGFFPMVRAAGDLDRMLACALDGARHDRLLEETGGVGGPLGEVRAAGEAVLERGDRAGLVATMLRLGFRRAELVRGGGRAPAGLAAAWAAAGRVDRALAIVRVEDRLTTVEGLCAVARRLLDIGERSRAEKLVAEAEELVLADGDPLGRGDMSEALVPVLSRSSRWAWPGAAGRPRRTGGWPTRRSTGVRASAWTSSPTSYEPSWPSTGGRRPCGSSRGCGPRGPLCTGRPRLPVSPTLSYCSAPVTRRRIRPGAAGKHAGRSAPRRPSSRGGGGVRAGGLGPRRAALSRSPVRRRLRRPGARPPRSGQGPGVPRARAAPGALGPGPARRPAE
ncbi:hypothetical protein [Streptomyces sp. NPDC093795]|uniref:hypothetical protein n=1 Tax=Streptomyces sp. NPDC093795 TaxID=3366051 RepID=UPI003825CEC6